MAASRCSSMMRALSAWISCCWVSSGRKADPAQPAAMRQRGTSRRVRRFIRELLLPAVMDLVSRRGSGPPLGGGLGGLRRLGSGLDVGDLVDVRALGELLAQQVESRDGVVRLAAGDVGEAEVVQHLVPLLVLRVGLEHVLVALDRRQRHAEPGVEAGDRELVLGEVGQHGLHLRLGLGGILARRIETDEVLVGLQGLARGALVAVRLLHPLGQAVGDLELHVLRLIAGGEAVQEVAVLGLGLDVVGGAALEVVGVGGEQQRLAAGRRVRLHLEGVGEVGAGLVVLLLGQQLLALGDRLLGGEAQDRVLGGAAALAAGAGEDQARQGQQRKGSFHTVSCRARARSSDISAIIAWGSPAPKTADPATQTSTPADTTRAMLSRSMPPSISILTGSPLISIIRLRRRALSSARGRNAWPPKPGLTDITSTKSSRGRTSTNSSTGVAGLIATPASAPPLRMRSSSRSRWGAASQWTITRDAPAAR